MLIGRGVARWALVAVASAVMGVAAFGIFLPALPDPLVFLLCVVFSGVGGLLPATLLGGAPLLAPCPRLTPISIGLVMQGSNLGQVIGPVAVGRAVDALGWSAAAFLVAGAGAVGTMLAVAIRQPFRRAGE